MEAVHLSAVPENPHRSPKGRFAAVRKHVSLALGGLKDAGVSGGGHPFDVEFVRVPPGCCAWPLHSHSAQWELYIVVAGVGEVRTLSGSHPVGAGDTVLHPPGEAHQIRNTGSEDLAYYVIADQPPVDVIHYPDSGKWMVKPERRVFRMTEAGYYDGEE